MPKRHPENFTHISLHIGPQNIFVVSMLFCFTISCLEDFFLLFSLVGFINRYTAWL